MCHENLSQFLYCPMHKRCSAVTHQRTFVQIYQTHVPPADKACSNTNILVPAMPYLELAKLPSPRRLTVDRNEFVRDIVLYPPKVETEADAERFRIRFLECPHPVEATDRLRFWDICEQGCQFEWGERTWLDTESTSSRKVVRGGTLSCMTSTPML